MCFICVSAGRANGSLSQHLEPVTGAVSASFSAATTTTATLLEGFSWTGTTGDAAFVTYNFGRTVEGGTLFNSTQRTQAQAAMQQWANVADVTFQSVSGGGDITFSQASLGGSTIGLATTFFSGETIASSEVQIDTSITSVATGTLGYLTLLHEIGHALGLKHPGDYGSSDVGPFLPSATDTIQNTVMSYNNSALVDEDVNAPITPMLYDIAAIQELYGANRNYLNGNTLYSYNGSRQTLTLWDGGGTDTISASSYTGGGVTIDLRSGIENVTRIGNTILFIAQGANLENAVGTSADDTLTGDDNANQITGDGGNDSITALGGNDTVYGGVGLVDPADGNDTIAGGNGADFIVGNTGDDILYGGVGVADSETSSDTIYGGYGRDALYGNAGDDFLYGGGSAADPNDTEDTIAGGKGADYIIGNGGNDVIYGGGGSADPSDTGDTIYAGVGDDVIYGNGGNDSIIGGPGNDQMHGGAGDDAYYFGSSSGIDVVQHFEGAGTTGGDVIQITSNINGSGITTTAQIMAALSVAGDGSAVILLGGSNLLTIQSVGASLTEGDFQIV